MKFTLRFPKSELRTWAARYGYTAPDDLPTAIGKSAKARGHLTRPEFLALTHWKSPRTRPNCERNPVALIRDVTAVALTTRNEQLAIEILTLLKGVSWPTASVILHFCSSRRYPILDFRALWTLSCPALPTQYDFTLWSGYVDCTRRLSKDTGADMRTVDRALWAYSKVNQR